MNDFFRRFPIERLTDAVLEENVWFTDLLKRWRPAGDATSSRAGNAESELARDHVGNKGECQHLRVAFRDGYMNFYCSGQSIAKVKFVRSELRAKIHEKYLYGTKTGERYIELTSRGFPGHGTGQLVAYEGMQEWISNASNKTGPEKRFVDLIVSHNHDVIDLEMGLPAYSAQRRAPRIDLLALEQHSEGKWQIVSWEVKLVGDGRARCDGDELPEVVDQLKDYIEWLSDDDRAESVIVAYKENCRLLVKLHEIALRVRPDIEELGPGITAVAASDAALPLLDKRPRLLIAYDKGDESFTENGHFDKLRLSGEHVKIVKRLNDLDLCQAQPKPL